MNSLKDFHFYHETTGSNNCYSSQSESKEMLVNSVLLSAFSQFGKYYKNNKKSLYLLAVNTQERVCTLFKMFNLIYLMHG